MHTECKVCGGGEWVCENHPDLPSAIVSERDDACDCGAGMPCRLCNHPMACAGYVEPWRELALRAIQMVESAVRETSWGQPTFGPDCGEELRATYDAMLTARKEQADG